MRKLKGRALVLNGIFKLYPHHKPQYIYPDSNPIIGFWGCAIVGYEL